MSKGNHDSGVEDTTTGGEQTGGGMYGQVNSAYMDLMGLKADGIKATGPAATAKKMMDGVQL